MQGKQLPAEPQTIVTGMPQAQPESILYSAEVDVQSAFQESVLRVIRTLQQRKSMHDEETETKSSPRSDHLYSTYVDTYRQNHGTRYVSMLLLRKTDRKQGLITHT